MDYFDPNNWELTEANITSPEVLKQIQDYLNFKGYIVMLHSHFCGARGATPSAYDDYDDFKEYLDNEAKPGDIIRIWAFPESEPIVHLKYPNEKGEVPIKGAY